MKRKLQVVLTEDAWNIVEQTQRQANEDFEHGHISHSDLVNEMIVSSTVDLKVLQAKHTNVRKSLRLLALDKEMDIDTAIKKLQTLKNRAGKKPLKLSGQNEVG